MLFLALLLTTAVTVHAQTVSHEHAETEERLSFSLTSTWQEFATKNSPNNDVEEKSVCRETLTIKSPEARLLKKLAFEWTGAPLTKSVSAALYQKHRDSDVLLPIEQFFVGDGTWHQAGQYFSFNIDTKIVALNTFYLVIHFPRSRESILRAGSFKLSERTPPVTVPAS